MRTNVPHIYAVGDVAGNWQLAHTAFREGEVAAENALGHEAEIDYRSTPRPIYTDPEIAAVGLTEEQAREQYGDDVLVGKMPYSAIGRAAMYGDRTGFVKTISESRYGELLGVVCVGTQATEVVNAGVVGIQAESTVETHRRRDRRPPDARRGRQGGRAGVPGPPDPRPGAEEAAGEGGRRLGLQKRVRYPGWRATAEIGSRPRQRRLRTMHFRRRRFPFSLSGRYPA